MSAPRVIGYFKTCVSPFDDGLQRNIQLWPKFFPNWVGAKKGGKATFQAYSG